MEILECSFSPEGKIVTYIEDTGNSNSQATKMVPQVIHYTNHSAHRSFQNGASTAERKFLKTTTSSSLRCTCIPGRSTPDEIELALSLTGSERNAHLIESDSGDLKLLATVAHAEGNLRWQVN